MSEKSILTVDLYDNILTEKLGDYTGRVRITGTLHNTEVAQRIVNERTEYRLETIENILNLADSKKVEIIAEGKSLVDGVGQYMLNISGSFEGENPTFDSEKHKLGITYTPSKSMLDALKRITVDPRLAKTGPVINTITDSTTGAVNSQITSGGPAIIEGNLMLLKGDDPTIGIYFVPENGGEAVKVSMVVTNTKSQIIFIIPTLTDGQYFVRVTTQAGANYQIVKEPRSYQLPILLTVGGIPTEPEEDEPVVQ